MSDETSPSRNQTACPTNRRIFLQHSIVASIAASVLGASSTDSNALVKPAKPVGNAGTLASDHSGGSTAPNASAAGSATPAAVTLQQPADAMDEKGMNAFPAKHAVEGGNE